MSSLPEYVDGLPNLSGSEELVERAIAEAAGRHVFLDDSRVPFDRIRSACAIALHMHQPFIPTGGDDLRTAGVIGNLQTMAQRRVSATTTTRRSFTGATRAWASSSRDCWRGP